MKRVNDILTRPDWKRLTKIYPEIKAVENGEAHIPGILEAGYIGNAFCPNWNHCPYGHSKEDCDCVYLAGYIQERKEIKIDPWGYLTIEG
jgi:hypothetical protein